MTGHRLVDRPKLPLRIPTNCLTCSKALVLSHQIKQQIKKDHLSGKFSSRPGHFCNRDCAGRFRRSETVRKCKCADCGKRLGFDTKGRKRRCAECQPVVWETAKCAQCSTCYRFKPSSANVGRFCSRQCYFKWISDNARKWSCLCCSKSFKVRSGRHSGIYCSRQCAKRYLAWENARKARCRCGKATGKRDAICVDCKVGSVRTWCTMAAQMASADVSPPVVTWYSRAVSMVYVNKHRQGMSRQSEPVGIKHHAGVGGKTCSGKGQCLINRYKKRNSEAWKWKMKAINLVSSQRKRMQRKVMSQQQRLSSDGLN